MRAKAPFASLFLCLLTVCLFSLSSAAQVSVTVASLSTTSPVTLKASASSTRAITGWQVYLDSKSVASGAAGSSLSASFSASTGSHSLVVRAWDSSGAYGSQSVTLKIASSSSSSSASVSLPTPPSTAKVISNINQLTTGWKSCHTAACAGGSGTGTYWQAFNQTSPSLSGRSMEFYQDGIWSNALFWRGLGANNAATNFLLDFYVYVDADSLTNGQALEFEPYQFVGGWNYMMGTQCDYGYGVWDIWNQSAGQWIRTSTACPKLSANTWHRIQWYITTDHSAHTYTYRTLVVDGVAYAFNLTQSAKYESASWADNVGVQWQLDVNARGGGYHQWVDNANLTLW